MQGQQIAEGATVYDAAGEKLGKVRAYDAQGGYLDVEKGWLFPKDFYIPLSAVQGTDADGDLQLTLHKDDLQGDQYAYPPAGGATTPAAYDQGVGALDTVTTPQPARRRAIRSRPCAGMRRSPYRCGKRNWWWAHGHRKRAVSTCIRTWWRSSRS